MTIIHPIDDFLFQLFPDLQGNEGDHQRLITAFQEFYTVGPFQPKVSIENGIAKVEINVAAIQSQKKDYDHAVRLAEKRQYSEAKRVLNSLLKDNPSNSEYHRIYGQILSDEGDQDGAINHLIDALRWNPRNNYALTMMGNIFAKFRNDTDTALVYYEQAVQLNPKDNIALNNIGANLIQTGKLGIGKEYFKRALAINPDYPNTLYALGLVAEMEGNAQEAFDWAIKALKKAKFQDPILQESIKMASEMGRRVTSTGEGQDTFEQYRKQLEKDGGLPIRVEENNEIPTAAKIEFAENYNRDYHQIRFKSSYPAVDHLKLHELVHLDLVIAARKANANKLFISRPEQKEKFIRNLSDFIKSLHKKGYPEQQLANYLTALFEGLNRQIYNAPIDLFIEDFLFKEFPRLRPIQFLSLYRLVQEGLQAVTDKRIVELSPREILSKSKVLNLVGAMQLKMLYGLDLIQKYNASIQEKKEADRLFEEYLEYRPDRKPGEEYEMVQHWAEDLQLTPYFELVDEIEYRQPQKRRSLDEALAEMEDDPYDLKTPDLNERERISMESQPVGQMAIAYYCLGALEWFEGKSREQIQEVVFEISMLGRSGIDPRNSERHYQLSTVHGKSFTGLNLLAWMYTGFQLFEPNMDTGLDFAKEYKMALSMYKPKS